MSSPQRPGPPDPARQRHAPGGVRSARLRRLAVVGPLLLGLVVEVTAFWAVAGLLGTVVAVLLVVGGSVLGGVLLANEGRRSVRRVVGVLREGGVPTDELADGVLGVGAAVLVLTPGIVDTVVGLLLYAARPLVRRPVHALLVRRARRTGGPTGSWGAGPGGPWGGPGRAASGDVVTGEVVDDDREA